MARSSSRTGIADPVLEQEAVELRLGQRIDALMLDRVLGRDHHEVAAERMRGAVEGDRVLLHGLQQRGLRLRRRAVDLVGEQQVAEDRPARQRELPGLEIVDVRADDIAGHQVGRELDASVGDAQRLREAARGHRLGRARRTFQQDVPAGEQRGQHQVDRVVLPGDRLADLCPDACRQGLHFIDVHSASLRSSRAAAALPRAFAAGFADASAARTRAVNPARLVLVA